MSIRHLSTLRKQDSVKERIKPIQYSSYFKVYFSMHVSIKVNRFHQERQIHLPFLDFGARYIFLTSKLTTKNNILIV